MEFGLAVLAVASSFQRFSMYLLPEQQNTTETEVAK